MRVVALLVLACACQGPLASDAEVCRDVVRRLCSSRCAVADAKLGLTMNSDCNMQLTTAAGCEVDSFTFEGAGTNRNDFLSCRLPIIRTGDHIDQVPACEDVEDMFRGCPSMAQFYGGPP